MDRTVSSYTWSRGLLLGGLLALLGTACQTTDQAPNPDRAPAAETTATQESTPRGQIKGVSLTQGMPASAIREQLGEPLEIEQRERDGTPYEVWHYRERVAIDRGFEATDVQMVPFIDPITGEAKERPESIMQQASEQFIVNSRLLIFDDRLVHWTQTRGDSRMNYQ